MLPQQPQFDEVIEQAARFILQFLSNILPQLLGQRRKIKELEARNAALARKNAALATNNAELVADNALLGKVILVGLAFFLIFLWYSSKQGTTA